MTFWTVVAIVLLVLVGLNCAAVLVGFVLVWLEDATRWVSDRFHRPGRGHTTLRSR